MSSTTTSSEIERTIVIKNLPRGIPDDVFFSIFSKYGYILDFRIVKKKKEHVRFLVIAYSTREEALNAVNHTNKQLISIEGLLEVRIVLDDKENPTTRTILVGNLNENINQSILRELFSSYGTICDIRRIPTKGFAFIDFSTHEEAVKAMKNANGHDTFNTRITVQLAEKTEPNSMENSLQVTEVEKPTSELPTINSLTGYSGEIVPFKGIKRENIIVVDIRNIGWCNAVSQNLKSSFDSVIGFDTETKPVFIPGFTNTSGPHLLQLCTNDFAFLFPLGGINFIQMVFPKCLKAILESRALKKVGFGIGNDLIQLERNLGVQVQNIEDVGGCKFAVETILHESISKPKKLTLSNWLNRDLTENQIVYAANDAYAALRVYHKYHEFLSQGIVLPLFPDSSASPTPPPTLAPTPSY